LTLLLCKKLFKSNATIKKAYYVILSLPLAQVFEDILLFPMGPIFFTPMKFVLFSGCFILIKGLHPRVLLKKKFIYAPLNYFLITLFIQTLSIYYASGLTFSQKLNYYLINFSTLTIVLCLSKIMICGGAVFLSKSFIKISKKIFFSCLVLSSAQMIFRDQLIYNIGNFDNDIGMDIVGFNIERLFLCEFLVIGYSIILLQNSKNPLNMRTILFGVLVFLIIFLSDSKSGLLGFLFIVFAIPKINFRNIVKIVPVVILIIFFIKPFLNNTFMSQEELDIRNRKNKSYFVNYKTENWRFLSSLSLLSEVYNNPTLLGRGYKQNEVFLSALHDNYMILKYNKKYQEKKNVSSHTFFSILYDQGILGFLIYLIMLINYSYFCIKFLLCKYENFYSFFILRITCILTGLMMIRFLFYYHTVYRWHFLILFVFMNYSYQLYKNITKPNLLPNEK
jgi:hypothetical protein